MIRTFVDALPQKLGQSIMRKTKQSVKTHTKLLTLLTILFTVGVGNMWGEVRIALPEPVDGVYTYVTSDEIKVKNNGPVWIEIPSNTISGTIQIKGSGTNDSRYLYIYKTNGTVKDDTRKIAYAKEYQDISFLQSDIKTDGSKYYLVFGTTDDYKMKGECAKLVYSSAPITYTVTFNANGHGTAPTAQTITSGEKATQPTAPTADGYTFGGWYKEESCTNAWDFENDVVTENITLYAKWTENPSSPNSGYSFSYGEKGNTYETLYFTQVGSTNEWRIENFVFPDVNTDQACYVGYDGYRYNDNLGTGNSKSADLYFWDMPLASMQGNNNCSGVGYLNWDKDSSKSHKVIGTLRIYDNSGDANLYVGFIPNGYGLRYGIDGESEWSTLEFKGTGDVLTTDVVTLTNDMVSNNEFKYYVGLLTSDGEYVFCGNSSTLTMGEMGTYFNSAWGTNLNTYAVGTKGVFRIWTNSCNNNNTPNFVCHFVPYYNYKLLNDDDTEFFVADGVSSEAADKSTTINTSLPTKEGYTCVGWSRTKGSSTTDVKPGDSYNYWKSNDVFYPVWQATEYTITYEGLGGATHSNPATYTVETETITFTNPNERTGYTFAGWNPASIAKGSTGNKTVTATWTANTYTVTFNANGGSGTMDPQTVEHNVPEALNANTFTPPTGLSFAGWNTAPDGTGTSYTNSQSVTLTADLTLYAQWAEEPECGAETVLKYVWKSEGTFCDGATPSEIAMIEENDYFALTGDHEQKSGGSLNLGNTSGNYFLLTAKSGYRIQSVCFFGKIEDASVNYTTDGNDWTKTITSTSTSSNKTYTIETNASNYFGIKLNNTKGIWIRNMIVTMCSTSTSPDPTDYTLTYDQNQPTAWNAQFAIKNIPAEQTLTGGTGNVSNNTPVITDGAESDYWIYEFNGWNTVANGSGISYAAGAEITITENTTLYAQWAPRTFNITYYDTDRTTPLVGLTPTSYTYGTGATLPTPTKTGYTFTGWILFWTGGENAKTELSTSDWGDVQLAAQWSENTPDPTTYTVTVTPPTNGTVTADKTTNVAQGETITLTVTPASGYQLETLTVKDASDNTVTVTDNKFTMPASNVTVSATFTEISTGGGASVQYLVVNAKLLDGNLVAGMNGAINQVLKFESGSLSTTTDITVDTYPTNASIYYEGEDVLTIKESSLWTKSSTSKRKIRGFKWANGETYTLKLGTNNATKITFVGWCGGTSKQLTIGEQSFTTTTAKEIFFTQDFNASFTGDVTITWEYGLKVIVNSLSSNRY